MNINYLVKSALHSNTICIMLLICPHGQKDLLKVFSNAQEGYARPLQFCCFFKFDLIHNDKKNEIYFTIADNKFCNNICNIIIKKSYSIVCTCIHNL